LFPGLCETLFAAFDGNTGKKGGSWVLWAEIAGQAVLNPFRKGARLGFARARVFFFVGFFQIKVGNPGSREL